jgi:signal transduction histidine kinase
VLRDLVSGRARHRRVEVRIQHLDGSYRLFEASATSLLDDPSVRGILVVARDITEQRAAEQERARLLASERQARAATEHALDQLLSLQSVTDMLATALTPDAVATVAVDRGVAALGAAAGAVALLTPSGESIDVFGRLGRTPLRPRWRRMAADAPLLLAEATRLGEAVWVESVEAWTTRYPTAAAQRRPKLRAAAVLPLEVRGRVAGALGLSFDEERQFDETDRLFIGLLARQCGQAFERVRLYQELAEREQRLQELVRRLLTGQEEERRRIACELHDSLAQVAAGTHQHLQTLATRYPPTSAEQQAELQRALELAQRTVREARSLIHGLRPTVLDDFGLVRAIGVELDSLRTTGCQVRFDGELGDERLPQSVETALYRVIQEALTNIRKHAGCCRVHVAVRRRGQNIRLTVRDWGRGFSLAAAAQTGAAHGTHVGLEGMQERIALLGGRYAIRTQPGRGTTIEVNVPVSS